MLEFILLITNHPEEKSSWTEEKHSRFVKSCQDYIDYLMSNGQLISAQPLYSDGKIISKSNDAFEEVELSKKSEVHVSYYHVIASDYKTAVEIAKKNPEFTFCTSAKIEVRQIKIQEVVSGLAYPKSYRLNPKALKSSVLKTNIEIDQPSIKVWEALTNPAIIKKYFFDTDCVTDWKKGSPIFFKGTWQGKPYEDKGNITDIEPGKFIAYNYWSSFSGVEDKLENYKNIRYELSDKNGKTVFTVIQDGFTNQETYDHSLQNWDMVLTSLKKLLEHN